MTPTAFDEMTTAGRLVLASMALHRASEHTWLTKRQLEEVTGVRKKTLIKVLREMEWLEWVESRPGENECIGGHDPIKYRLTSAALTLKPLVLAGV